jgi:hypothetical protein
LAFACSFAISRLAHAQAVDETGSAPVAAEERLRNFKLLRDQENWAWLRREHLTADPQHNARVFQDWVFLETSLPGRNITYGAAWASYKF